MVIHQTKLNIRSAVYALISLQCEYTHWRHKKSANTNLVSVEIKYQYTYLHVEDVSSHDICVLKSF